MYIPIYFYTGCLKDFFFTIFFGLGGVHAFLGPRSEVRGKRVGISFLPLCEFPGLN